MPIQLNYVDGPSGLNIPTSYWFVGYANIDNVNNTVQFIVNGYFTLAAKNAGKAPWSSQLLTLTFAQLGLTGASTLNQLLTAFYTFAIANSPFFSGGTIV